MGSTIVDGARIGKHCLIGAGSLVTSNMVVEDGMLVLGTPAKVVKPLTESQIQALYHSAENYVALGKEYKSSVSCVKVE